MKADGGAASVQERADAISGELFLGGPPEEFEQVGRLQLIALLREGLQPNSKTLDVGCGCLRGGYWLLHFLDPGCYFGIEPNETMLRAGLDHILEPGLVDVARPRFSSNDNFDFSVFGAEFDFVIARSIWTHASKAQISMMLDSFERTAGKNGVMLTSYLPSSPVGTTLGRIGRRRVSDYLGSSWVGRSHQCDEAGVVAHNRHWIRDECARRDLRVRELDYDIVNGQRWLRISRGGVLRSRV